MGDTFMNKNVNIMLLFLIILVVGIIAAGTVYFQDIFSGLTGKYSSTTDELKQTSEELAKYKQLYTDAMAQLNRTNAITEQEKADLRKVYTVKKDLADQLNDTLVETEQQLKQQASTMLPR